MKVALFVFLLYPKNVFMGYLKHVFKGFVILISRKAPGGTAGSHAEGKNPRPDHEQMRKKGGILWGAR